MRQIFSYLKPYKWKIALATLLMAVSAGCDLLLPTLMSNVLDKGVYGAAESGSLGYIFSTAAWMLGLSFLSLGTVAAGYWVVYHVVAGYTRNLRSALFKKVHTMTLSEVGRIGTSNLVTRMTHDVGTLNWIISSLTFRFKQIINNKSNVLSVDLQASLYLLDAPIKVVLTYL